MTELLIKHIADTCITSRGVVRVLFDRVGNEDTVLCFEEVEFISRSSAHELLDLLSSNKSVYISNMAEELLLMLKAVESTMSEKPLNTSFLEHA